MTVKPLHNFTLSPLFFFTVSEGRSMAIEQQWPANEAVVGCRIPHTSLPFRVQLPQICGYIVFWPCVLVCTACAACHVSEPRPPCADNPFCCLSQGDGSAAAFARRADGRTTATAQVEPENKVAFCIIRRLASRVSRRWLCTNSHRLPTRPSGVHRRRIGPIPNHASSACPKVVLYLLRTRLPTRRRLCIGFQLQICQGTTSAGGSRAEPLFVRQCEPAARVSGESTSLTLCGALSRRFRQQHLTRGMRSVGPRPHGRLPLLA